MAPIPQTRQEREMAFLEPRIKDRDLLLRLTPDICRDYPEEVQNTLLSDLILRQRGIFYDIDALVFCSLVLIMYFNSPVFTVVSILGSLLGIRLITSMTMNKYYLVPTSHIVFIILSFALAISASIFYLVFWSSLMVLG